MLSFFIFLVLIFVWHYKDVETPFVQKRGQWVAHAIFISKILSNILIIKLYIAINSFEALEAFRYFYDDCVIYNAETSKVIKCLDSYEAYTKEILSPIMKAFGKDLAFFKDFIKG